MLRYARPGAPNYLWVTFMLPEPLPLRDRPHGVLIPAYQAAGSLPGVLRGLAARLPPGNILVVDDGSRDGTAAAAERADVHVLRHRENRGKGAALMTGLGHARDILGWEWAVTMDADGQHAVEDLDGFLAAVPGPRTGLLAGTRTRAGSGMPWHRRFSNASTTGLVSRLAGRPVFDAQCGYRAYRLELAGILPPSGRFEWESQALILAARGGWDIESVPVRTVYAGEGSHMDLFRDTARFLRMALRMTGGGRAWTR
jgi:glycosyltransferase involved in cell wall biosynthesis